MAILRALLVLALSGATALRLPVQPRAAQPRASPQMGLFDGIQAGMAKIMAGEYDGERSSASPPVRALSPLTRLARAQRRRFAAGCSDR